MEQKERLVLFLVVSTAFIMLAGPLLSPRQSPAPTPAAGAVAGSADAGVAAVAPRETDAIAVAGDAGAVEENLAEQTATLERPAGKLVFTNYGAGLLKAELTGTKEREQKQVSVAEGFKKLTGGTVEGSAQMNVAQPPAQGPLPLSLSISGEDGVPVSAKYAMSDVTPTTVTFVTRRGAFEVTKRVKVDDSGYGFSFDVLVKNVGTVAKSADLAINLSRGIDPTAEQKSSFFGGIGNESGPACLSGTSYTRVLPGAEKGDNPTGLNKEEHAGPIHFFGIDQQYFLGALYPKNAPIEGRCTLSATTHERVAVATFPVSLEPNTTAAFHFGAFFGPKDLELLQAVAAGGTPDGVAKSSTAHPNLDRVVDFGLWAFICRVLLAVLKLLHGVSGNWGWAIILLTVGVKIVLLPLTHKAMVSAESMKKLQPRMEELKKKFPDDRERQQMEMMKLYQEAKVNPLGGCLPLLVQLPIWAALFTTLRTSYELYGEPFIGPVWTDLTYKDPTYILPLALGITMIVTQRLQPQMMDETQAKIMTWFMPIFFTLLMLNYPAGLSLYIFTNNLLSIAQQFALKKFLASRGDNSEGGKASVA